MSETTEFGNDHLEIILDKLQLNFVIINLRRLGGGGHFNLVMRVQPNQVQTYDPFGGTRLFLLNDIMNPNVTWARSRMLWELNEQAKRRLPRGQLYPFWHFLRDKGYYIQNPFTQRVQSDSWNCGPLCIYGGIKSGSVRMPLILK